MSNLDVIEKNARENHVPVMLEDGMEFLVQYIREHEEIVNILEIGTAVGLSSMKMAEIRETIHIDTLEVNEEMYKQAVNNIKENHLENQITVHLCDGALYHTDKIYDLIFVDAAKSQYKNYVEQEDQLYFYISLPSEISPAVSMWHSLLYTLRLHDSLSYCIYNKTAISMHTGFS